MKDSSRNVSRLLQLALRLTVATLVITGMSLGTGCSWFKKKPPVTPITAPATRDVIPTPPASTTPMPADNRPEGPRPGTLLPLPELKVVYFDYDKSTLRSDQLSNMDGNLQFLRSHPEIKVMIEGHCDERGSVEYNFGLGERRAQAIRDYYVKNGVPAERVTVISKGKEEPADPSHSEAAFAKNRRAEFKRVM